MADPEDKVLLKAFKRTQTEEREGSVVELLTMLAGDAIHTLEADLLRQFRYGSIERIPVGVSIEGAETEGKRYRAVVVACFYPVEKESQVADGLAGAFRQTAGRIPKQREDA